MAIVKMSEFNLFAFDHDRTHLLHELQKFEYVHFLCLDNDDELKEDGLVSIEVPESIAGVEEEIREIKYSLDILSNYHESETGINALRKGLDSYSFNELEERASKIDYLSIYNEIKEYSVKKDNLIQEINKLKTTINELKPWVKLNSPIRDLDIIERSRIFLGLIPIKFKDKLNNDLLETKYTYFENVIEDKENLYLFAISDQSEEEIVKEILRNNSFSIIKLDGEDTPKKEIEKLNNKINEIEKEIKVYDGKIKDLAVNLPKLEIVYEYLQNKRLRIASSENFLTTEKVNVIKGYVPTHMTQEFEGVVKNALNNVYYLEVKDADKDDVSVPILLKNSKFAESFESLTGMYALPKYTEVDPTPFLAPFYLIFFGMMAADIGYGLIMLIGTFIVLRKFNLSEKTEKFMRFFYYLSFSVIAWGFIYGSLFGGIIPMKGLVDPAKDYMSLLVLSVAFGLIHVYFALGLKAYLNIRDGKIMDAIYDVGFWFLALTGGIVFLITLLVALPSIVKTISLITMIAGMVGIVATGGRETKNPVGRIVGGLYSLYGISGYVGDFVSYSRLMALGLAGGFIAGAVNMMAGMVAQKGIIGIILAVVIFIFGQIFNLGLSMLGAYVHTIRLTFVEFFGKFYEGGGKNFKLFRSEPKYINLK